MHLIARQLLRPSICRRALQCSKPWRIPLMSRSWTRYSIVPNNEPGFFSQFLGSLQPGMSVQEVENAVDDYVASIDEENLLSSINRQEMTMKELLGANNYEMFRERLTRAGLSDYLNKLDLEDRSSGALVYSHELQFVLILPCPL